MTVRTRLAVLWALVRQFAHCAFPDWCPWHLHWPALLIDGHWPTALLCYDCERTFYGTPQLIEDVRRLIAKDRP